MIAEIGHLALILAFLLAIVQAATGLWGGARRDPAGRGQDDLARAPRLIKQIRGNCGGLASPRRRYQHACAHIRQRGADIRQNGMDRQVGAHRPGR